MVMRQSQLLTVYFPQIKVFTVAVEELSGFVSTKA